MTEGQTAAPPAMGRLIALTLGTAAVAAVLTVMVVLPAEFGRDPTGFGALTGLKALGAHAHTTAAVAHYYDAPYRSDVIEIPLAAKDGGTYELEYKVRMAEGQALIYSWEAMGAGADEFYFDLHSETADDQVVAFKQEVAARSDGALIAPMDGVHGWYWQNRAATPVTVRLKIAGFYELIPPGETGNKAGVVPSGE